MSNAVCTGRAVTAKFGDENWSGTGTEVDCVPESGLVKRDERRQEDNSQLRHPESETVARGLAKMAG